MQAPDYIKAYVAPYGFVEDPKFSRTAKFALKVTYWKDSEIVGKKQLAKPYIQSFMLWHMLKICLRSQRAEL